MECVLGILMRETRDFEEIRVGEEWVVEFERGF